MTKAELINNVAKVARTTKKEAGDAVTEVFDSIKAALLSGDRVAIPGFGTFTTASRDARTGRNPATGEKLEIPACKTVKFKVSKELKGAVA